jgi:hypothetical protein
MALFPFWGDYCLVDFALGNFSGLGARYIRILLDSAHKGIALALNGRWKLEVSVAVLERGITDLFALVERENTDVILLCALSSISLFDPRPLIDAVSHGKADVVKVSIQKTPVEIYCARRSALSGLLASHCRTPTKCRDFLQGPMLHAIDLIEELDGRLMFQHDIMDLYRNNLWLASNWGGQEHRRLVSPIPEFSQKPGESRISDRGFLKDSYIAAGAVVDGYIENSVIFSNVTIRSNSHIMNSVVMSNNRIGTGVSITNSLILPFVSESPRGASNIGDRSSIGGRSQSASNNDFPEQIREGLSLVGMSAAIPSGFRAEAGSFISASTTSSELRRQKILRKGASYIKDGT